MTGIKETTELGDFAFNVLDTLLDADDTNLAEKVAAARRLIGEFRTAADGVEKIPGEVADLDRAEAEELGRRYAGRIFQAVQKART